MELWQLARAGLGAEWELPEVENASLLGWSIVASIVHRFQRSYSVETLALQKSIKRAANAKLALGVELYLLVI